MDEEYVIHGGKLDKPVSKVSSGVELYNALKHNKESPIFIDALTGEKVASNTLIENACRLGQSLRNYGIQRKDIIGICSENNLKFFDPILAGLFTGIAVTTFSSQYTERELMFVANLSQPSVIFCSIETVPTVLKVKNRLKKVPKIIIINKSEDYGECQCLNNFISENISKNFDVNKFEFTEVNVKEDVAFILYSSGTSGMPKGVMITHLNANAVFAIFTDGRSSITQSPCIAFLPYSHGYGLFLVLRKLVSGSCTLIMKKFDPHVYLKTIQDYKIADLHVVPPVAQFLAKTDLINKYDLSSVQSIFSGAAPLSKSIEQELEKRFKVDSILQGYGLIETTVGVIGHFANKRYPLGATGIVLPTISIKIVDLETGKALGPMKAGELCVRSDTVMKGYLNDVVATKRTFDDHGWLRTGDVGYYDNDHIIYIVDRIKELIKCKGHQIAPAELESLMLSHPKIADVCVVGIPDEKSGEVPLAFVVKVQNQNLSEKEVEEYIAGQVAPYKRLRGVRFVSQIPRNPSGKILRRVLRDSVNTNTSKL